MKAAKTGQIISLREAASAAKEALLLLHPSQQLRNPVMFATDLGAALVSVVLCRELYEGHFNSFTFQIALWLWFTVLFGNMAFALAQQRGKAQADALRQTKREAFAHRCVGNETEKVDSGTLRKGDKVVCYAGEIIPADGEIIEGVATIDESAITGESAPVVRESGSDRSAVTMGTRLLSDSIKILVTQNPGGGFIDRMIQLIESAKRQKTPNEIALNIVLAALSLVFLVVVTSLKFFIEYTADHNGGSTAEAVSLPILTALFVCLIPTTIAALLNAVGIAGMFRLMRHHVIAKSGSAVEAAGDIDLLLLDKTGTITLGNRMALAFIPAADVAEGDLAEAAQLASLGDETPEGRSVVIVAKERFRLRGEALAEGSAHLIPFSAKTRMSGVDIKIEIVEVGKQILMTRGALTTFSIANDVAKYFAILPATFSGLFVGSEGSSALSFLNIMGLSSPSSALLSAVIFNALIIVFLIPLALYGVPYKPRSAQSLLLSNLLLFGLGGLVAPFVGIKCLNLLIG